MKVETPQEAAEILKAIAELIKASASSNFEKYAEGLLEEIIPFRSK